MLFKVNAVEIDLPTGYSIFTYLLQTMFKIKLPLLFSLIIIFVSFCGFTPKDSEALCIKNEKANLRKGPGTHHEKLWEVFKYMPFKQLGVKGAWKRIKDIDGDIYWVHGPLTTQKYKCAVIKNDKTNLRSGPGTNFPKVPWAPVDKFFSMKVPKIKKKWVHIEDSVGDKAWVFRSLVWIQ